MCYRLVLAALLLLPFAAIPVWADSGIPGEVYLNLNLGPQAHEYRAPPTQPRIGMKAEFLNNRIRLNISMVNVQTRQAEPHCSSYAVLCGADELTSNQPYQQPDSKASLGLAFDDLDYTYYLKANAEWDENKRAVAQPDLPFMQEHSTRVNLRIGLSSLTGRWTVEVWGSSMTDNTLRNLTIDLPLLPSRPGDLVNATPRSYGLTLKSNF